MKIDTVREGGSALLQLEGRLDREWAEHLSGTLEDLLQDGVRTLNIDFSGVTYVSSEATRVLTRWHQELAMLRGDMQVTALPAAVRDAFDVAGWNPNADFAGPASLRHSSWHMRTDIAKCGDFEFSSSEQAGGLTCRLHGDPDRLARAPFGATECAVVPLTNGVFGLGLGGIGGSFEESSERFGELIAVAACAAYFPSDGTRKADYLVGAGPVPPRVTLATGLTCEGDFSRLVRFTTRADAEAVPLSELATVCLDAAGKKMAGLVIAGETAGLSGARLRRSPTGDSPVRFDLPEIREWLSFAPERTYAATTALIVGVVARTPEGPLAAHLRPIGLTGRLFAHFHAAVFSYRPLPQRTVNLSALVRGLFANHDLLDVVHLVQDDRGDAAVGESAVVRGVGWVAPITQVA
ncbi:MAG: STAS domain-containing protein [Gemmatimonadales bacterium]